jgi:hypothetical protein
LAIVSHGAMFGHSLQVTFVASQDVLLRRTLLPLVCFLDHHLASCSVLFVACGVAAHFTSVNSRDHGNP